MTSPGTSAHRGTACPTRACSWLVRGRFTPACRNAHCTSPEQSHEFGPTPPHWYGFPVWVVAAAKAIKPAGLGIGRAADPLLILPILPSDPVLPVLQALPGSARAGARVRVISLLG